MKRVSRIYPPECMREAPRRWWEAPGDDTPANQLCDSLGCMLPSLALLLIGLLFALFG